MLVQTAPRCALPVLMTDPEIALLDASLRCADRFLEFGVGGSTLLAASLVSGVVVSVDSSPAWIDKVDIHLAGTPGADRVTLALADIGEVDRLGYPVDPARRGDWPRYHRDIWDRFPADSFDLFLIDGRFRVACFLQVLTRCRDDALILVHDYPSRQAYEPMRHFGRAVCRAGNLTGFLRLRALDRALLEHEFQRHEFSPE